MPSEAIPSEANKDTVRRFYEEVFGQGNLELANDIFADGYVLHDRDQDPDQTVHGPAGIADFVRSFRECFSDTLQVSIIENPMAVEGNRVVTRFTVSGIFGDAADRSVRDDFRAIQVEWEGMSISQFSEGKITESWSYWESGRMYEQLGYFAVRWKRPPR